MASRKTMKGLEREYQLLAKRADMKLLRLERLSSRKGFENVLNYAYSRAMKSISKWSGSDANRFNRDMPKSETGLRAKIADINRFLKMTTSSKAQIKKSYIDRAKTTNEKYGTSLKWEDLEDLFESELWEKLVKQYGSKTAAQVIGQIQDNKDYIRKKLESHEKVNFNIENEKVGQAVEETIAKYGIDLLDMF